MAEGNEDWAWVLIFSEHFPLMGPRHTSQLIKTVVSLLTPTRENRTAKVPRTGVCRGEALCLLICQELSQCVKAEHCQQFVSLGSFFSLEHLCSGPSSPFSGRFSYVLGFLLMSLLLDNFSHVRNVYQPLLPPLPYHPCQPFLHKSKFLPIHCFVTHGNLRVVCVPMDLELLPVGIWGAQQWVHLERHRSGSSLPKPASGSCSFEGKGGARELLLFHERKPCVGPCRHPQL